MKQKYISQVDSYNFLYPNHTQAEYDVNIVHDLIEAQVSGTTTQPTFTSNGANIDVSVDYTWDLNGAEPFIDNNNKLNLINVYFQTPDKPYLNMWINVYVLQSTNTALTSTGGTLNFTITPAMMGQTSFSTNGNYSITFQFISRRCVKINPWLVPFSPIAVTPTPTPSIYPTPTPSATPGLPTTPTPTMTPSPSSGSSSYNLIGSTYKVGATSCDIIGTTPTIYLNNTDYAIFNANGGCFSGDAGTVSVIRDASGTPLASTFYFIYYGGSCSLTTFKSTSGNLTLRPEQC